jgi:phage tail sheath protein FI
VNNATVSVVHTALRDLCASTREHFALLSVPKDWDELTIARHVAGLHSLSDRSGGGAALESHAPQAGSFVALYHPWLLQRNDKRTIQANPPEGALLGVYARRSRNKGAWAAAGLDALDAVGLTPAPAPGAIEAAGGNAIEIRSTGISATRAFTLAQEEDWQALGVRRLFILLRRLARREGELYLFEPNDFGLRRSLERGFDNLLARLMRAGAFRGNKASESYLLRTANAAQASAEIERGECSLEIQVAPSQPLRFLSLQVLRSGEQLQIEDRN